MLPNIIFMHSHNTGQFVQPYGHAIPAPNLQRLAEEGIMFRRAFAAAPTCSPSRAAFLSGMAPHSCGMMGLAHRGFPMADYDLHMARVMKTGGYLTASAGVEHTSKERATVGYDRILSNDDTNYPELLDNLGAANAVVEFLHEEHEQPFFISMGLNETHRPFPKADPANYPAEDARFTQPVPPFPDTPTTRADAADLKAAVRVMDKSYGAVLDALDETGLAENTLLFCFSDHGLQFPQHMCNLTDRGLIVYLIIRGPDFRGGRVLDQMVSLIDLAPTAYRAAQIEIPETVQGSPLQPLVAGEVDAVHGAIFGEVTYHASYEPMRCARTERYKYIRRYDNRDALVLPNVDDTPSKQFLLNHQWTDLPREQEMLYDLIFDPHEMNNLLEDPAHRDTLADMRSRLDNWMQVTNDPILESGFVSAPTGSEFNDVDGLSPNEKPIKQK